ncbi:MULTISPECIES: hypothetical protein [unclassified Curtobacterium]|uniref:hypothetical protein n=1 Tax=unclassified Curtobacterium TaxID=257496 RepID=UPI0038028BC5
MHKITRGVVSVTLLTAATVLLAGCATTDGGVRADPAATSGPTATSTPSATAAETATVDFGKAPAGSGVPSCAALLPADLVDALVPGTTTTDLLTTASHVVGSWSALGVAGGADCWSTNGVSPVDDVEPGTRDDPKYEGVRVSVLPHAASAFDTATSVATSPAESTTAVDCAASDSARVFCHGGVLAGSAWVSVQVTRLQTTADATPQAMLPVYRDLLDQVRAAVAGSPAGAASGADSADWAFTPCSPDRVNAVTSVTLRDAVYATDTPPAIDEFVNQRIGSATCSFVEGERYNVSDALYSATPDAAWVVEQRLAAGLIDRAHRIDLPGLGDRDGAWRTCDETACSVDIVHDGTWLQYFLTTRVAPNTSSAVERWAEASFSAVDD